MTIFQFLIFLGIINIIFSFIWKWIFVLPSAILFTYINFEKGLLIIKAFGAYLLVSLTALAVLLSLMEIESGWKLLFFPIVGVFVLLMVFASSAYEREKEARLNHFAYDHFSQIFDVSLMFASIVLFILILFIPSISQNKLISSIFEIIVWASEVPILGWIIGIGGVLFMLNIIFHGFIMIISMFGLIYAKLTTKHNN